MRRLFLFLALSACWCRAALPLQVEAGPDKDSLTLRWGNLPETEKSLLIVATSSGPNGAGLVPFAQNKTGSTLFLPFQADRILLIRPAGEPRISLRTFNGFGLAPETATPAEVALAKGKDGGWELQIPRAWAATNGTLRVAAALKDLAANSGWGRVV
ncbi:MAG: hypothetical protein EBT95_09670, partial [Verrucomicrobia bacterium]|nr:hypothetical protein [Verrucomicrobiota bacterium]